MRVDGEPYPGPLTIDHVRAAKKWLEDAPKRPPTRRLTASEVTGINAMWLRLKRGKKPKPEDDDMKTTVERVHTAYAGLIEVRGQLIEALKVAKEDDEDDLSAARRQGRPFASNPQLEGLRSAFKQANELGRTLGQLIAKMEG